MTVISFVIWIGFAALIKPKTESRQEGDEEHSPLKKIALFGLFAWVVSSRFRKSKEWGDPNFRK